MSKRAALVAAMLLAGAVIAVIGATAALRLLGNGTSGPGGKLLSQADVQRDLASAPGQRSSQPSPAPVTTRRSHPPGPSSSRSAAAPGIKHVTGGTVVASCSAGQVTLTGSLPAQGYQIDGKSLSPATVAWVKFKNGATEQTVSVTCEGGTPHFVTSVDVRGGGAGGDDHGGSSGGSGSSGR